MTDNQTHDFAMERRLRQLDPELHTRFANAVFALQYNLSNYKLIFPEYTDHTTLHSLTVIDFCNKLIGDQIERLNADELYALLMASYFHDTGMGVTMKDYEAFSKQIRFGNFFETHSREDIPAVIRTFHNEFSGLFIQKYAPLFEFPSEVHQWAIAQISRGHRKTDLMDESEYPLALRVPNGNTVCLPYLAALIRLADEIDVAVTRNSILLYDLESATSEAQIIENKKLKAVSALEITEKSFVLHVNTTEDSTMRELRIMVGKMQKTLDVCRAAVCGRTPYVITQEQVLIGEASGGGNPE